MLLVHAYEVAKLYDDTISTPEEREQFPKPHWVHDLVQFDRWVMKARYRPMTHPREKTYSGEAIQFDNDYLAEFAEVGIENGSS